MVLFYFVCNSLVIIIFYDFNINEYYYAFALNNFVNTSS